jgi:hypothetical protein
MRTREYSNVRWKRAGGDGGKVLCCLHDDAAAAQLEFNDLLEKKIGRLWGIPVLKLATQQGIRVNVSQTGHWCMNTAGILPRRESFPAGIRAFGNALDGRHAGDDISLYMRRGD